MSGEQAIGEPLGGPTDLTTDVSFSPDGKRLVAGKLNGDTIVYDTATRRQALRIDGGSVVTAVAFHPGGKLVAVGSIDGQVRFFDPKTGASVGRPLDEGNLPVWQVAFSPNGKLLAVGGFQTRAMLWEIDPAIWRRRACAIAGRNLTREEWKLYLPPGKAYRGTCSAWPTS